MSGGLWAKICRYRQQRVRVSVFSNSIGLNVQGYIAFDGKAMYANGKTQCPAQATTPMVKANYYLLSPLSKALARFGEGQIQLSVAPNGMLRMQNNTMLFLLTPTQPIDLTVRAKTGKKGRKAAA